MGYIDLQNAVNVLETVTKCHICVHDVSGILKKPHLKLARRNQIHSRDYCTLAKTTKAGFDACIHCKNCSNSLAITGGEAFGGLCAFGLYEMVKPVILQDRVLCIIYLGNMVMDVQETTERLHAACKKTGAPENAMEVRLSDCEQKLTPEQALEMCELLDSYIRMLYEKYANTDYDESASYHWSVEQLKLYADVNYRQSFTLESVCRLYFINEKYAGSLFRKQMGMTFHEYLNSLRLSKAAEELEKSGRKIVDIALSCGFNNVTYFNRKFQEFFGKTPGDYRRDKEKE